MSASPRLPALLRRGRRRILGRIAWIAGMRAAVTGVGSVALLFAAGPLLGWPAARSTTGMAAIAAVLLTGSCALAWVAWRRAESRWPRDWDDAMGLPDRVTTAVALLAREHPSPWVSDFLGEIDAIPLPERLELAARFPVLLRRPLACLALGLAASAAIWGASPHGSASIYVPPASEENAFVSAEVRQRMAILAAAHPGGFSLERALAQFVGEQPARSRSAIAAAAEEWRAQARARAAARLAAADMLDAHPSTRDLATWLRDGVPPADAVRAPLDDAARALLRAAAATLAPIDALPSRELERLAAGDEHRPLPALDRATSEWSAAEAASELLERPAFVASAPLAVDPAAGGEDARRASPAEANEGSAASVDEAGAERGSLPAGVPIGESGLEVGEPHTPIDASRWPGDPPSILLRPEVEEHWLSVVDAYLRARAGAAVPPGASRQP